MIHEEIPITVEGTEVTATLTTYLLSQYEDCTFYSVVYVEED